MTEPRANPDLLGHEGAERVLRTLYREDRLPHAILLAGPRGIGKATLAFRFARFVLASGPGAGPATGDLAVSPESGVFRRVASGSHADLLTIERAIDRRRARLKSEIGVDEAREAAVFLRMTAAEEGWRVVIVDGAEEMTRSAQNALLKILEEPPQRAFLLLVSHSPARLLPTIRSRCRRIVLGPLSTAALISLLARYCPQIQERDRGALARLSEGSIGRALDLAEAGGLDLYRSLLALFSAVPGLDLSALHAFTAKLLPAGAEDAYRAVEELILTFLARVAAASAGGRTEAETLAGEGQVLFRLAGRAGAARWALVRRSIEEGFARARDLNLDKRHAMLAALFAVEEAAG